MRDLLTGWSGVEVIVVRLATSTLGELVVQLTTWEKVGALHRDLRVPLSAVRAASVVGEPWKALHGIRAPGTGWPGWIMLGTAREKFGKDWFLAVSNGFGDQVSWSRRGGLTRG
jgi:hypothetical protein